MFLEKCTNLIQLQLHRIIQCIDFFSSKHRKTKDSCAACREHRAVLDDGRTVDDEHRQAALPRPIGDNAHEGLLLIRRCLTVEEDLRHLLPGCPRRSHCLEHSVLVDAPQSHLLEKAYGQKRNILCRVYVVRSKANRLHHPRIGCTMCLMILRQIQQPLLQECLLLLACHIVGRQCEDFLIGHSTAPMHDRLSCPKDSSESHQYTLR